MKLLVTGFGPFRIHTENPSSLLAPRLSADFTVLSVQYSKVESFARKLAKDPPERILCLGLNAKAEELRFELYAHNAIGTEPGSSGRKHSRTVIKPGGAKTLGQTFLTPLQLLSCPLTMSYTPGNYLCNFLLYSLLWRMPSVPVGFVHVPLFEKVCMEEQLSQLRAVLELSQAQPAALYDL